MFTLDLCMERIWEKVLVCWDTFLQSMFTNFSAELGEEFFCLRAGSRKLAFSKRARASCSRSLTLSGPSFLKLPSPQGQIFLDLESVLQPTLHLI